MKARIGLLQEHIGSTRLNNWVVYNRDEVKDYWLPKLEAEYMESWDVFVKSLPNILQGYNKDCLFCNGIRKVISV
jgi:predicted choloylglycine hydrolase